MSKNCILGKLQTLTVCCAILSADMQHVISLAAYTVRVWNPSDKDHEILSNFDAEGADLFGFMHDILRDIKNKALDDDKLQQAMSVLKLETNTRTLSGVIETGQYGHESKFINVKTKKLFTVAVNKMLKCCHFIFSWTFLKVQKMGY
jgi:hypothetical protein